MLIATQHGYSLFGNITLIMGTMAKHYCSFSIFL